MENARNGLEGVELVRKIEEIIRDANESGIEISLNPEKIHERRQHSYWYGGEIGSMRYKGYIISVIATGDMVATLFINGREIARVKDKIDAGDFYHEMSSYIDSDEELESILVFGESYDSTMEATLDPESDKALLIESNNWVEVHLVDEKTGRSLTYLICEDDDVLDGFQGLDEYIQIIDEALGQQ